MNKNMSFSVSGQRIELTDAAMLVAGTVNEYTARFTFDESWDGYKRTAVFYCNTVEREQLLTDDACTVPWEVLVANGYLRVGVYGTKDGSRLPTIWTERSLYINPGAGPTQEAADPSPTLVEQLLGRMGDLAALKTEDKSSLVAAINEVWSSGGSGGASVTDAAINEDGHLIITLSTGETIDAGYAVGPAGAPGAAGKDGQDGAPGKDGTHGADGKDGITPTIGDNGNWYLGETDTGKPSRGEQGEKGDTGAQGAKGDKGEPGAKGDTGPAGVPGKDGAKGDPGAPGKDGHSPVVTATKSGKTTTISVDGAAIATVEDGADGKPGAAGSDGITPHIGKNGNWYLGDTDTGKPSRGADGATGDTGAAGADGITPHIGDNGNWYIGSTDTGKPSRGAKGDNGDTTVVDAALDGTSNNPVQNKAIYAALAAKAERVNSAERTVRVEISGTLIYVYFFSGSGYWVRLCFQSRSASGQSYSITRLNGARASKDRDFGTYITIVPEGYLEYVFAARIGGSNGAWVGGFAHGYENATKTVISLDSMPLTGDGTYYGRELRLEQTSEIYNPTGGAKIADHYVLNTITADDGWRVAQTIKWVSAVKLSADTYLCMFALTRNSIAKMARNYDYTLCNVPAYGESNATLGAKVDASACVMTGDIDCEVEQLETSGNDCHLFYSDNTYQAHYKVYFRFLTGETEIASGTVFSSKFRVAFNSQLSAVSSNVIHGDEYYTKDETEAKIAELLGVVENGTY